MKRTLAMWFGLSLTLLPGCSGSHVNSEQTATCTHLVNKVDTFKTTLTGSGSFRIGYETQPNGFVYRAARLPGDFFISASGDLSALTWSMLLDDRYYETTTTGPLTSEWPTDSWIETDPPPASALEIRVLDTFVDACRSGHVKQPADAQMFVADAPVSDAPVSAAVGSAPRTADSLTFTDFETPLEWPDFNAWKNRLVLCDVRADAVCE